MGQKFKNKYLCFLDDDDTWEIDYLKEAKRIIEKETQYNSIKNVYKKDCLKTLKIKYEQYINKKSRC